MLLLLAAAMPSQSTVPEGKQVVRSEANSDCSVWDDDSAAARLAKAVHEQAHLAIHEEHLICCNNGHHGRADVDTRTGGDPGARYMSAGAVCLGNYRAGNRARDVVRSDSGLGRRKAQIEENHRLVAVWLVRNVARE